MAISIRRSVSIKRPEADQQPTRNPNYKRQSYLSPLLHLSAAAHMPGSLLRSQLLPILPCTRDSFPFSPALMTPRAEQQPLLPLHASSSPASLRAMPLHAAQSSRRSLSTALRALPLYAGHAVPSSDVGGNAQALLQFKWPGSQAACGHDRAHASCRLTSL
jgi:hypothetical protein